MVLRSTMLEPVNSTQNQSRNMVYENDYGHPVYYIDGNGLKEFIASRKKQVAGCTYEWEDEQVVHIYFSPLSHGYGNRKDVVITKDISAGKDVVFVANDGTVTYNGCSVNEIPSVDSLYSRTKGLIELDVLEKRRVLIIGLGSGGSAIAVQLARTGIGHFVLADFDRVELHNLSRHVCSLNDLGRLKTDALYDAIKGKNPYAEVKRLPIDVNKNLDVLEEEIHQTDIVLCCTDNNSSRFNISELLVKHRKVGLFGRCVTRAAGGDVFIYRPGSACYVCLIGNQWYDTTVEEISDFSSAKRAGRIPAYVSEDDAAAVVQVGLGADIEPINNMMVKLALVELCRGTNSGISSLENELTYNYYFWANRRELHYATWGNFNNTERMPTILKWYGVNVEPRENCTMCGKTKLHTGNEEAHAMSTLDALGGANFEGLSL